MPDHDFVFALDLSDEPHFDTMLRDLAAVVLRYTGYDPAAADAMIAEVRGVLAAGVAAGRSRCRVQFAAAAGTLRISVAFAGDPTWETARALPAGS